MDPVQKLWMFHNWIADKNEAAELAKNQAYLVGSFINPEAVNQMLNSNKHISTDAELEESMRMVREATLKDLIPKETKKRRRRRKAN